MTIPTGCGLGGRVVRRAARRLDESLAGLSRTVSIMPLSTSHVPAHNGAMRPFQSSRGVVHDGHEEQRITRVERRETTPPAHRPRDGMRTRSGVLVLNDVHNPGRLVARLN